jgi:ribosomal protein L24
MLYAFTDESYSSRQYFQAAFIINESVLPQIEDLRKELLEQVRMLGIAGNIEFHGHSLMNAKDEWWPLSGQFHLRMEIFKSFMSLLSQIDGSLLIEGINITDLREQNILLFSPHGKTTKELIHAIDQFAGLHHENVQIYSDKISKEDRKRIKLDKVNEEFQPRWIESINYVESSEYFGVQIADMCIYLYRRLMDHKETNRKTRLMIEELWGMLEPVYEGN